MTIRTVSLKSLRSLDVEIRVFDFNYRSVCDSGTCYIDGTHVLLFRRRNLNSISFIGFNPFRAYATQFRDVWG